MMYSRRINNSRGGEYPYSIPPRYSGSRFYRNDGRADNPAAVTIPPPEEVSYDQDDMYSDYDDTNVYNVGNNLGGISDEFDYEDIPAAADEKGYDSDTYQREIPVDNSKKHFNFGDILTGIGSEELLIIAMIVLLSSDGNKSESMSDIVPMLALLLLLK